MTTLEEPEKETGHYELLAWGYSLFIYKYLNGFV